jgi:hypothetical protein
LGKLGVEIVILSTVDLDFLLQIGKPLLLALSALESGDTTIMLVLKRNTRVIDLPISFEEVLSLLFVSHLLSIRIILVFAHVWFFLRLRFHLHGTSVIAFRLLVSRL